MNTEQKQLLEEFIKQYGFSYSVEDVIKEYTENYGKCYVSYTMKICCRFIEDSFVDNTGWYDKKIDKSCRPKGRVAIEGWNDIEVLT